ncbi:hypothetical protein F4780DRAFT_338448 [Xylariomycetidae sp. FL0641]|nr:hypothetical protein F4780DRAFT_338448 [Xylariomycetidae sp. FL0641]
MAWTGDGAWESAPGFDGGVAFVLGSGSARPSQELESHRPFFNVPSLEITPPVYSGTFGSHDYSMSGLPVYSAIDEMNSPCSTVGTEATSLSAATTDTGATSPSPSACDTETTLPLVSTGVRNAPTPAEWESMKQPIKHLYIVEKRPLKEVMKILSGPPWNFDATRKGFKKHFEIWKFWKNGNKARAQEFQRQNHRDTPSEDSVQMGNVVKRWRRRKGRKGRKGTRSEPTTRSSGENVTASPEPGNRLCSGTSTLRPAEQRRIKFRVEVYSADEWCSAAADTRAGNPNRQMLICTDVWGPGQRHELSIRAGSPEGNLALPRSDTHAFQVTFRPTFVNVNILSPNLRLAVNSAAGLSMESISVLPPTVGKQLAFHPAGPRQVKISTGEYTVSGSVLIRVYDHLLSEASYDHQDQVRKELRLLKDFLEDRELWHHFAPDLLNQSDLAGASPLQQFVPPMTGYDGESHSGDFRLGNHLAYGPDGYELGCNVFTNSNKSGFQYDTGCRDHHGDTHDFPFTSNYSGTSGSLNYTPVSVGAAPMAASHQSADMGYYYDDGTNQSQGVCQLSSAVQSQLQFEASSPIGNEPESSVYPNPSLLLHGRL